MPRECDLTGTRSHSGQKVSHSNHKTKRRFDPNLQRTHLFSDTLGRSVALRVSTRALRTVQKHGGLDAYLLGTADTKLGATGLRLKRNLRKHLS